MPLLTSPVMQAFLAAFSRLVGLPSAAAGGAAPKATARDATRKNDGEIRMNAILSKQLTDSITILRERR